MKVLYQQSQEMLLSSLNMQTKLRKHYSILFALFLASLSSNSMAEGVWNNIQESLSGVSQFATALFFITGFGLSMGAIYRLKKFGHRTAFMHVEAGILGPACQFFIGVALMFSKKLIETMNYTVWQSPDIDSINNWPTTSSMGILDTLRPMVQVIQIVGMFAFLRGFLLLSRSAQHGAQPGTASKGVVHLVGGVLAMNIVGTVNVLVNSITG